MNYIYCNNTFELFEKLLDRFKNNQEMHRCLVTGGHYGVQVKPNNEVIKIAWKNYTFVPEFGFSEYQFKTQYPHELIVSYPTYREKIEKVLKMKVFL